jgi:hypothetical protein
MVFLDEDNIWCYYKTSKFTKENSLKLNCKYNETPQTIHSILQHVIIYESLILFKTNTTCLVLEVDNILFHAYQAHMTIHVIDVHLWPHVYTSSSCHHHFTFKWNQPCSHIWTCEAICKSLANDIAFKQVARYRFSDSSNININRILNLFAIIR